MNAQELKIREAIVALNSELSIALSKYGNSLPEPMDITVLLNGVILFASGVTASASHATGKQLHHVICDLFPVFVQNAEQAWRDLSAVHEAQAVAAQQPAPDTKQ